MLRPHVRREHRHPNQTKPRTHIQNPPPLPRDHRRSHRPSHRSRPQHIHPQHPIQLPWICPRKRPDITHPRVIDQHIDPPMQCDDICHQRPSALPIRQITRPNLHAAPRKRSPQLSSQRGQPILPPRHQHQNISPRRQQPRRRQPDPRRRPSNQHHTFDWSLHAPEDTPSPRPWGAPNLQRLISTVKEAQPPKPGAARSASTAKISEGGAAPETRRSAKREHRRAQRRGAAKAARAEARRRSAARRASTARRRAAPARRAPKRARQT